MANPIIKICGICDPDIAKQAAIAGADLIGMVFHPSSPRYVTLAQAAAISQASKHFGAQPVAVFVNQTDTEMREICEVADIQIIQLHGEMARAHHHFLPDAYQRIDVLTFSNNEVKKVNQYLDPQRDWILIDHPDSGQGKTINWQALAAHLFQSYRGPAAYPWILAGGLTPENVAEAMRTLQPNGLDVSSGVESSKGHKNISLIQQFIQKVRGHQYVK